MNEPKKLDDLRLRVYKVIILMLVVLYFNGKYRILGDGTGIAEKILMGVCALAILGEVLKFLDVRKEKTADKKL